MGTNVTGVGKVNLAERINHANLPEQQKTNLLIELVDKDETIREGVCFMLRNLTAFENFGRAIQYLKCAQSSYSMLGFVETSLQKQIDIISHVDVNVLGLEKTTLCLCALQNMIMALGYVQTSKDKPNEYMPHLLHDFCQMMQRGESLEIDTKRLKESVYSPKYRDPKHPKRKFIDANAIQRNMEDLSRYQATGNDKINQKINAVKEEPFYQEESFEVESDRNAMSGITNVYPTTDERVNRVLNAALARFDVKDLKNNLPAFYNFVKKSFNEQNKDGGEIDYQTLHEDILTIMQRIVEIGNSQQRKKMAEQQKNDVGMTL